MKKYYLHNSTQWDDKIFFIEAISKKEAVSKLIKKYDYLIGLEERKIQEIKEDCLLLATIDNPDYEG